MSIARYRPALIAGLLAAGLFLQPGVAPAEDYFAGKLITINVGLPAGGGYDLYTRLLAQFWGKHIPGHPDIIVQNRPGAGSVRAANYVYEVAAKDGTQLALTLNVTAVFQALHVSGVKYDVRKVNWIGNMVNLRGLMVVWHTAPAKTMEEVRKKQLIVGTTGGKQGEAFIYATMMKAFTGSKLKIIGGYQGSSALDPALERGEIQARSVSWTSLLISKPDWIKKKLILPLVQVSLTKDPHLPNTPLLIDYATSDDARKVIELISSTSSFSRAVWGPPGMKPEVVAILRKAFDDTMKDPAFLADAEKRKFEISPDTGAEVAALAKKAVEIPPHVVEIAREAMK
jgi:tripartite-type tricarboxylate transporter receptor subunit TctC